MAADPGRIDRPVFLVGTGRSGTTVVFETLANHPDVGWFSYHLDRLPRLPVLALAARLCDVSPVFRKAVTASDERRPWLERLRDGPSEAYNVWESVCGEKFRYDYLLDRRASEEERAATRSLVGKVLAWEGKSRFAAKVTGPARMGFLLSLFPDARFVNVIRDGRAVVHSLLNVDFWRGSFRESGPAWEGGLREEYRRAWEERGRSPLVLAAVQWRNLVERAREERDAHKPERYVELRYEDFLEDPHGRIDALCEACDLEPAPRIHDFIEHRLRLRREPDRFREALSPEDLETLNDLLGTLLVDLGYEL